MVVPAPGFKLLDSLQAALARPDVIELSTRQKSLANKNMIMQDLTHLDWLSEMVLFEALT